MAILKPYKVASYRRLCDICGRPRQIEDIRFSENVAICSIHPEFRTAQVLNKINARVRPTKILPVPRPKPFNPVDTWTAEEAQIFNFVTKTAPFQQAQVTTNAPTIIGPRNLPGISWAIIYLTGLLLENRRPAPWLTYARQRAIALGDLLITTITPPSDFSIYIGGFNPRILNPTFSIVYEAIDTGLGIAAFCRLYQVTKDEKYLRAALLAAPFVLTLQATDLNSFDPFQAWGAPALRLVRTGGPLFLKLLFPSGLLCAWGLSLLQGIVGDITLTPGQIGAFTSDPSRPISVSIEQMRAFWATGANGVNGFTPATPFTNFDVSAGVWTGPSVTTSDWAAGIFSLAEIYGVTDQVSDLWTFLSSLRGGGLDTSLAPPVSFTGNTVLTNSYDWASAGLLSRITAAKASPTIKNIKDTLAMPRQRYVERTPRSGETLYLGPLGISGPLFQPVTSTFPAITRTQDVVRASQVAQIYRQQPQGFTGRGH